MRHTQKAFKINTVVFLKQDAGSQERDPGADLLQAGGEWVTGREGRAEKTTSLDFQELQLRALLSSCH